MSSSAICIELHYLGSLEFFTRLINSKKVTLEVTDYFLKQTYRNRCYIMGPNGIQMLTVPVHYHKKLIFRDVTIDYNQNWIKDHRKALQAAYGKAPFFDYFYDLFDQVWVSKPTHILDLSMLMMTVCLKILQIDMSFNFTTIYQQKVQKDVLDLRDVISTKKFPESRSFYRPIPYIQNFGSNFAPNLSIIDLIMCEGPNSINIIKQSIND
ncbi:MAG: hypothetical protein CMB82_01710 [Flammeovirgaceae bacterium]|nr:hypothetical protein [Flammeovirgaceae bacterium]